MIPLSIYKQLGAFLLLIVVLMQTFNKTLIVGDYYLHTDSYAAYCENKANIELHCNGQCVMAKKLQEAAEKEKKQAENRVEIHCDFYFSQFSYRITALPPFPVEKKQKFPELTGLHTMQYPQAIFRPPIA